MIESVWYENDWGEIFHPEQHGMILKSFDAPPPDPKVYRESVDGADGDIDMTEWAGFVRFNNRTVSAAYRDMDSAGFRTMLNFLHGRRVKITHGETPELYYVGRCESYKTTERRRVTDAALEFVCQPYAMRHVPTTITCLVAGNASVTLRAERKPVSPKVTLTAPCVLLWGGKTISLNAGTYNVPNMVITDRPQTLDISGSGQVTLQWRDGVI